MHLDDVEVPEIISRLCTKLKPWNDPSTYIEKTNVPVWAEVLNWVNTAETFRWTDSRNLSLLCNLLRFSRHDRFIYVCLELQRLPETLRYCIFDKRIIDMLYCTNESRSITYRCKICQGCLKALTASITQINRDLASQTTPNISHVQELGTNFITKILALAFFIYLLISFL